jgi:hypothetical protein
VIHWIEAATTTVRTTGVNWSAVGALSTPTLAAIAFIGRTISRKLNSIGDHLERQDRRGRRTDARVSRIEGKLGLDPVPADEWDR